MRIYWELAYGMDQDQPMYSIHIKLYPQGYVAWDFPRGLAVTKRRFDEALRFYAQRRTQCLT